MSYYCGRPGDENWKTVQERLSKVKDDKTRVIFLEYLSTRRINPDIDSSTLCTDADEFQRFGVWLTSNGKNARKLIPTKDITAFLSTRVTKPNGKRYAPATQYKTYVVLKAFFRWLHDLESDEKPPEFKGIHMKRPKKNLLRPEDLITAEELARMLGKTRNAQERSLTTLLHHAGPRAGEVPTCDIDDVAEDKYGVIINMKEADGQKTGPRPIRIVKGTQAYDDFKAWLKEHKYRHVAGAPLYYGNSNRYPGRRMGYQTIYAIVKRLQRDAGIKKRIYPHLFRHTSATNAVKRNVPGPQMEKLYGWQPGTDMMGIYCHLNTADADKANLVSYGIELDEADSNIELVKPITCIACETKNAIDRHFCSKCDMPLTTEAEAVVKQRRAADMEVMVAQQVKQALKAAGVGI